LRTHESGASTGPLERLFTLLDAAPVSSDGSPNEARLEEHRPDSGENRPNWEAKAPVNSVLPPDSGQEKKAADEQKSTANR
jgi:hypothetical protein